MPFPLLGTCAAEVRSLRSHYRYKTSIYTQPAGLIWDTLTLLLFLGETTQIIYVEFYESVSLLASSKTDIFLGGKHSWSYEECVGTFCFQSIIQYKLVHLPWLFIKRFCFCFDMCLNRNVAFFPCHHSNRDAAARALTLGELKITAWLICNREK